MDLKDYQANARKTAIYPSDSHVIYPVLGLAGEKGEVCEKLKKQIRDNDGRLDDEKFLDDVEKELGDVLWYVANLASDLKLNMDQIAKRNLDKLRSRKKRGKLQGSGDNR